MKVGRGEYSLMDIVQVAANPGFRTSVSPFGSAGTITRYVGRSVPWKGVRGIDQVRALNAQVAAGLTSAIGISRAKAGVGGVSLVRTISGAMLVMPTKSAQQSIGRPVEVMSGGRRKYVDRVAAIVRTSRTYAGLVVPAAVQLPPMMAMYGGA